MPNTTVWEWVNADTSACNRRHCNPNLCFFQKARSRLQNAHIIIINHSLLFSLIGAGLVPNNERGILYPNDFIVIDEAQDLDTEVMEQVRLLSNLETDDYKLMQIILAGQPELRERLAQHDLRQLRQRILIRCHLSPLEENEVSDYISHRLQVAGAGGDVWFEPEAIAKVYEYSNGIPRLINAVCDLSMLSLSLIHI